MKKASGTYGTPSSSEPINTLWKYQKRRERKVWKAYLKKKWQKASQIRDGKSTSRFVKFKEPKRLNIKRSTPRHIVSKLSIVKDKERILKATREKQLITFKVIPIRLSVDFSAETLQAKRE